jgi:hypothetical protein
MRPFLLMALICAAAISSAADSARAAAAVIDHGPLPQRVHVFEDYETEIEKRWWLRGVAETSDVAPSLSESVPNRRACRANKTKDFDDKLGDPAKSWKAVVFNPVPGPPMGANTRLSFRYRLERADTIRVQIFSLSSDYHRQLILTGLPQGIWKSAAVDMTTARRPDGSGGPLAADERIDDIQFYVPPEAELLIDDIVLYDAAGARETESFPKRIIFTGWFDTGNQGAEWPGDFEIVPHEPPLTWKAAKSVLNAQTSAPGIRVHVRGARRLSESTRLRFRYRLTGTGDLRTTLVNGATGEQWSASIEKPASGAWGEARVDFKIGVNGAVADEIRFVIAKGSELLVDDLLLYEPREPLE